MKYLENEQNELLFQPPIQKMHSGTFEFAGKWGSRYFKNTNPITLEIGCGKAEYTLHLAKMNKNKNYIGIDIKGARIWRGAKTAAKLALKNVAFLRISAVNLLSCFAANEIQEIWFTFPDPQIKAKRAKHRLVNTYFLEKYRKIIAPGGKIHFKTDNHFLYGYLLGILEKGKEQILYTHHDIYNNPNAPVLATEVQTFYEKKYLELGKPIAFISFSLNKSPCKNSEIQ